MIKDKTDAVLRMHKPTWKRVQAEALRRDIPARTLIGIIVKEWFTDRKAEKANK